MKEWQRTKLAQVWGRSLASYIYERLVRGIDDPTASVDSIEWLNQKKDPNKVCHTRAPHVQLVPNACHRCRTWGSNRS